MCLITAFVSGLGCMACIHSFIGGAIGLGIINLSLCLINAGWAVFHYMRALNNE